MRTLKNKSILTVVVYLAVHILAATLVFGCENRKSFYDNNRDDINLVPIQMENPDDPIADDEDAVIVDLDKPSTGASQTKPRKSREGELPPPPTDPAIQNPVANPEEEPAIAKPTPEPKKPSGSNPQPAANSDVSRFIKVAFWVVQNEARKIGTPCNFYVSRVLVLNGYSKDGFLANDFDIYARKNFSSYKDEKFSTTNVLSERLRLKRYLLSYPSRTPFIMQWERQAPKPGHIAIVERIGDQLIIYQASLNRHIARREQTSIDRLLSGSRPRLTVYSEFVAK